MNQNYAEGWKIYVADAHAVLEAIREPSAEMLNDGELAWMSRNLADPKSEPMRDCWQAMIDAALLD